MRFGIYRCRILETLIDFLENAHHETVSLGMQTVAFPRNSIWFLNRRWNSRSKSFRFNPQPKFFQRNALPRRKYREQIALCFDTDTHTQTHSQTQKHKSRFNPRPQNNHPIRKSYSNFEPTTLVVSFAHIDFWSARVTKFSTTSVSPSWKLLDIDVVQSDVRFFSSPRRITVIIGIVVRFKIQLIPVKSVNHPTNTFGLCQRAVYTWFSVGIHRWFVWNCKMFGSVTDTDSWYCQNSLLLWFSFVGSRQGFRVSALWHRPSTFLRDKEQPSQALKPCIMVIGWG